MGLLILKNFITFFMLMWFFMVAYFTNTFSNPPSCKVHYDGNMFYSCSNSSTEPTDDLSTTEVHMYDFAYTVIVCKATAFLFFCFLNNNLKSPFALKYYVDEEITRCTWEEMVREVVSFLKMKLDIKYIMIDIAKHLADIAHIIIEVGLSYYFSFNIALSMGYNWEEAKYEFFPTVKKCHFDHWPYLAQCTVEYGNVFKVIFIALWSWYGFSCLMVLCHIINRFRRYFQTRQKLERTYYTKKEGWLVDVCEENLWKLNMMAKCLRMGDFKNASHIVVMDPRVGMYASKRFFYNIKSECSIANNCEMITAQSSQPV